MTKKRDLVVPEMRERLAANRSGKLTTGQWLDIVMQPLTPMLLLLLPAGILLLPRLFFVAARGGWIILVGIVILVLLSFVFRAYRYARAPIHFDYMTAHSDSPPVLMFWQPIKLIDTQNKEWQFDKRLAPRPRLAQKHTYLVYYLPEERVLLSIAPADHADAEWWKPDQLFSYRFKRRGGS